LTSFGIEASWLSQVRARAEWSITWEDFHYFLTIYLPSVGEHYFILWGSRIFFRSEKTNGRLLLIYLDHMSFNLFLYFSAPSDLLLV